MVFVVIYLSVLCFHNSLLISFHFLGLLFGCVLLYCWFVFGWFLGQFTRL